MALDFKRLNDPAVREQMRLEREAADAKAREREQTVRGWLGMANEHIEELSEKERSFVRNCQHRMNTATVLSVPQEKWLQDIANRFS